MLATAFTLELGTTVHGYVLIHANTACYPDLADPEVHEKYTGIQHD